LVAYNFADDVAYRDTHQRETHRSDCDRDRRDRVRRRRFEWNAAADHHAAAGVERQLLDSIRAARLELIERDAATET